MSKISNSIKKDMAIDILVLSFGSLLYALSVVIFTSPNNIAPGGITGFAIIFNYLFLFPLGFTILLFNLPLFFISLRYFGSDFLFKTIYATIISSVFIEVLTPIVPHFNGEGLLAALYGGVISGFGLSLVFMRGGTTGGIDIASRIFKKYFPSLSLGRIILMFDFFIVVFSAFAFRSINSALYAIVTIFCSTTVIDNMIYGNSSGKIVFIISSKNAEIEDYILNDLSRGVTVLKATGGYSSKNQPVLMCVVKRYEVSRLTKAVLTYDSSAFIVVGNADEINGLGFTNKNLE